MAQKFAVFDIDGTIIRTGIFAQVVDELIARGHLPRESRVLLDEKKEQYRIRSHEDAYREYVMSLVDILFSNLTNLKVRDYRAAVDAVIARCKDATYTYTRDLVRTLRADGYFLIALSGSEMYSVQKFTAHHGFDIAIGETYHEEHGVFTGQTEDVIHNKHVLLKNIIGEHDLTLEGSIAVGDTRGDISMLEMVENPIAFNPEKVLFETASQQGWKIVVERKNMIYEFQLKNGSYCLTREKPQVRDRKK